jgi:hypothetical protein
MMLIIMCALLEVQNLKAPKFHWGVQDSQAIGDMSGKLTELLMLIQHKPLFTPNKA